MKKLKIFWNFEKEEKWLSDMAKKGLILKKYSSLGIYTFTKSKPQNLNYKIDYKLFKKKSDYTDYLSLFEDAGWQHIWGSKCGGNHYFLPKSQEAGTEIFSDAESANKRYQALFKICLSNFCVWLLYCIALLYVNDFNISQWGFLTPGLWDKAGAEFWRSFFFELPFVIGRVGLLIILTVIGISYGYWGLKAKKEYDHQRKEKENLL